MQGRLTKDQFGLTMPVQSAAYVEKPSYWRNADWYTFEYRTDPEAAAAIVPEQLELTDPTHVRLIFADYEWSTGGPYREILQCINVVYDGEEYAYFTQAGVSQSIALMAGREGYGFPKKIGHISFEKHEDLVGMYYERPQGLRLMSGVFRGISPMEMPESFMLKGLNLRVIQSPDPEEPYSLAELVLGELECRPKFAWLGEGNCHYTGVSDLDPWHQLPVREKIQESWMRLDINLAGASILERL